MSFDADHIVDRRRMRRKLTFWRVIAVLVAIVAVTAGGLMVRNRGEITGNPGAAIARVTIEGVISSNRDRAKALDELAKSSAKAVIVHVNSPGGTVTGSEELYQSLTKVKEKKPLVVVIDGLAASGGYITAMAADHIVAPQSAIVGSIGVIFQYPNVTELLSKVGVQIESIKSSPLKASPSGYEPTSPEARAAVMDVVKDSYDWFKGLVRDRRQLDNEQLEKVADGRVFSGRQALALKLVDALGDEQTAIDWLAKEKNIDAKTPVRDVRLAPRFSDLPFLRSAAFGAMDAFGLGGLVERFRELGAVQAMERLNLDGLLVLWHPPANN